VTEFFIPGAEHPEEQYARIREAAHTDTGHKPQPPRIFKLSFRRNGVDHEAEVGKRDPVGGFTVLAILDLGRREPYLIQSSSPGGPAMQILVSKPVYSVTEFSP
jgi:hypothetical protein